MEALEDWANEGNFMMGGLGFYVGEPDLKSTFHDFFLIMYGNNREKRILRHSTTIIEQSKALITGFCKLTKYQKTQWAEKIDSWPPLTLRVQLNGLAESWGFLEKE